MSVMSSPWRLHFVRTVFEDSDWEWKSTYRFMTLALSLDREAEGFVAVCEGESVAAMMDVV